MTTQKETGDFCISLTLLFFLETVPNPKASVVVSCELDVSFLFSGLLPETFAVVHTHLSSLIHLQLKTKKAQCTAFKILTSFILNCY